MAKGDTEAMKASRQGNLGLGKGGTSQGMKGEREALSSLCRSRVGSVQVETGNDYGEN